MLTADIDADRSIVTFRNEDDKTELTISTAPPFHRRDNSGRPSHPVSRRQGRNRAETDRGDHHIAYQHKQLHSY